MTKPFDEALSSWKQYANELGGSGPNLLTGPDLRQRIIEAQLVYEHLRGASDQFLQAFKYPDDHPSFSAVADASKLFFRRLRFRSISSVDAEARSELEAAIDSSLSLGLVHHLLASSYETRHAFAGVDADELTGQFMSIAPIADIQLKAYNRDNGNFPSEIYRRHYDGLIRPMLKRHFKVGILREGKLWSHFEGLFFAGVMLALQCDLATLGDPVRRGAIDDRSVGAKDCAVTVHDALASYIKVHNDLFEAKVQRLLPIPGFFEAIDFKAHVATLAAVEDTLVRTRFTIVATIDRDVPEVCRFLETLETYRAALLETVKLFRTISENLYRKSQDPTNYKWGSYRKDLVSYEQSIERYKALGAEVNTAYGRIR